MLDNELVGEFNERLVRENILEWIHIHSLCPLKFIWEEYPAVFLHKIPHPNPKY